MKWHVESSELQYIFPAKPLVKSLKAFYWYKCESVFSVKSWVCCYKKHAEHSFWSLKKEFQANPLWFWRVKKTKTNKTKQNKTKRKNPTKLKTQKSKQCHTIKIFFPNIAASQKRLGLYLLTVPPFEIYMYKALGTQFSSLVAVVYRKCSIVWVSFGKHPTFMILLWSLRSVYRRAWLDAIINWLSYCRYILSACMFTGEGIKNVGCAEAKISNICVLTMSSLPTATIPRALTLLWDNARSLIIINIIQNMCKPN